MGRGRERIGACPNRCTVIKDKIAKSVSLGTGLNIEFYAVSRVSVPKIREMANNSYT